MARERGWEPGDLPCRIPVICAPSTRSVPTTCHTFFHLVGFTSCPSERASGSEETHRASLTRSSAIGKYPQRRPTSPGGHCRSLLITAYLMDISLITISSPIKLGPD